MGAGGRVSRTFTRNHVTVELDGDATRISAGVHSWPFFTDSEDHGGVTLNNADADDLLAALWVSHLARQGVGPDTLQMGADVQGVTISIRESSEAVT